MVPADQGAPLSPPSREHDAVALVAPETSSAETASSIGGAEDMLMSRYLSILGIGIIDLDATELLSNDREILDAVMDRVFIDPSLLEPEVPEAAASVAATSVDMGTSSGAALASDAVVLELPALHQDGDVGGSAPFAAPEAAEGVLGESVAGAESAVIAPPL
jgi:hypothetical protein